MVDQYEVSHARTFEWTRTTVVIGTYGDPAWKVRGEATLTFNMRMQAREDRHPNDEICEFIHVHADTLAKARNHGAELAGGDWIVFLDASDAISRNYCYKIREISDTSTGDVADILKPSTWGFREYGEEIEPGMRGRKHIEPAPVFGERRPLIKANFLTIGSPVKKKMWGTVGGFDEWPCLEDWAFWLKCEKAGATIVDLPEIIYHINDEHERSLNVNENEIAQQIRARYR